MTAIHTLATVTYEIHLLICCDMVTKSNSPLLKKFCRFAARWHENPRIMCLRERPAHLQGRCHIDRTQSAADCADAADDRGLPDLAQLAAQNRGYTAAHNIRDMIIKSDQCSIPNSQFSILIRGINRAHMARSWVGWELRIEHWSDLVR